MTDLQKVILDIYKEIKKICDANNIRYFAIGGTSIGAERHKGFIPWDDDLDIAIPNTDYQKFVDCCKTSLPDYLRIFDYHESEHCLIYWNKIHNSNTTFLEKNTYKYKDYHYGVFVDVMPMYGVPDDIEEYNRKIKMFRILNTLRQNSFEQLSAKKKLAKAFATPLLILFPRSYWVRKMDIYQAKYDFDKSKKVGYTWHTLNDKLVFEREWFNDFIDLPFEDTTMRCCRGNKEMLKRQFGDYLKLPPVEEQVSDHYVKVVDLENSFMKYGIDGKLKGE
ncbi:MAG: LicD family protein [Tenericutes bacterium ADurb.BinA124]|nr:MAG: LicD family protein [Tenericutes bacterium ADurb.BinA124]